MVSRAVLLIVGFGSLLTMLFSGFLAPYSGLVSSGIILVLATILPDTRLSYQNWFVLAVDSGRDGLSVLLSCAAIGIVIAAITSTGLGIKLNQEITALGDENLLAALILAALCSIVLGMGLPTAASYLMVIFVAGPAIMELGVSQLSTHLFVFYYAVLSAITPPVALAIFAAAAIAKENPIPLALNALRLASVGFVLPIAWVYNNHRRCRRNRRRRCAVVCANAVGRDCRTVSGPCRSRVPSNECGGTARTGGRSRCDFDAWHFGKSGRNARDLADCRERLPGRKECQSRLKAFAFLT